MFRFVVVAAFCTAVLLGQSVMAQDRVFAFSLTGGGSVAPDYFGADSYRVMPGGSFGFTGLRFGNVQLGEPDGPRQFAPGTGLRGALRYIPEREGKDELAGLNDVDASLELGLGLQHTSEVWQVYGELRYGVIGHRGLAGEIGANAIFRSEGRLVLNAGPRAEFANSRFASTYFGVTAAEAARSGLGTHTVGSGVYSIGFEIGAYQPVREEWGITGSVRYDRLHGDAGDSPIVLQGSRNQLTATIGLTRHFNLRF